MSVCVCACVFDPFFLCVDTLLEHKSGPFVHMYVRARLWLCKRVSVFVLPAPAVTECL